MRLSFLAFFLLLLICSLFTFSRVTRVCADVETIHIRADGAVEPLTAPLFTIDNVTYTLMSNVSASVVIERDNIIFDGVGNVIQGDGDGTGIALSGRNNVTIKDVEIKGFYQGILIYNFSRGNTIVRARLADDWYGGIVMYESMGNNITENVAVNCGHGISVYGNSENNTISYNNVEGNDCALSLLSTSNNIVEGNSFSHARSGIRVWMSSCNNVIMRNNVTYSRVGIEVSYSSNNNTVSNNNVSMNEASGIAIGFLIPESGPEWGGAANNYISGNHVTGNGWGINLIYSKNNTIFHNDFRENNVGAQVYGAKGNRVFLNDFINNSVSAQHALYSGANAWDDGAVGNYWSDYNGTDADNDGIGELPYEFDNINTDHHPLMMPHDFLVRDLNNDGKADMKDVALAAFAFGTSSGQTRWNPMADTDNDNMITMKDIEFVANHFGEKCL